MAPQKHPKLRRALKLPFHGRAATTASGRNAFAPRAGEQPIVYLRVQLLGGIICRRRIGMGSVIRAASSLHFRIFDKMCRRFAPASQNSQIRRFREANFATQKTIQVIQIDTLEANSGFEDFNYGQDAAGHV
ncbi:hypothetical protein K438DRAFT_1786551 [Mycena galopus ATCC 62051]|nr:hypothetical protein K438DRAFT_1786551 [Mycena galopus ATCC 62051]